VENERYRTGTKQHRNLYRAPAGQARAGSDKAEDVFIGVMFTNQLGELAAFALNRHGGREPSSPGGPYTVEGKHNIMKAVVGQVGCMFEPDEAHLLCEALNSLVDAALPGIRAEDTTPDAAGHPMPGDPTIKQLGMRWADNFPSRPPMGPNHRLTGTTLAEQHGYLDVGRADLRDEVEFDTAMRQHGVPAELIGRAGFLEVRAKEDAEPIAVRPIDLGDDPDGDLEGADYPPFPAGGVPWDQPDANPVRDVATAKRAAERFPGRPVDVAGRDEVDR